jgi:hypothetical protein
MKLAHLRGHLWPMSAKYHPKTLKAVKSSLPDYATSTDKKRKKTDSEFLKLSL